MNDRLKQSDWIEHGFRTLIGQGAHALKVGPMSAALNVSRGSFYWHFADIADFRAQLLRIWKQRATDEVIRQLERIPQSSRLKQLMHEAFGRERRLDRAIRSWAVEDEKAADLVASVDAERTAYIEKLLAAAGVEPALARPRAVFLYWAYLGQSAVMDRGSSTIKSLAVDEIAALFER